MLTEIVCHINCPCCNVHDLARAIAESVKTLVDGEITATLSQNKDFAKAVSEYSKSEPKWFWNSRIAKILSK